MKNGVVIAFALALLSYMGAAHASFTAVDAGGGEIFFTDTDSSATFTRSPDPLTIIYSDSSGFLDAQWGGISTSETVSDSDGYSMTVTENTSTDAFTFGSLVAPVGSDSGSGGSGATTDPNTHILTAIAASDSDTDQHVQETEGYMHSIDDKLEFGVPLIFATFVIVGFMAGRRPV